MVNLNFLEKALSFQKKRPHAIKKAGLFAVVFLVYFYFSFFHLTKFITSDESIWWIYDRVPKYWNSLLAGKLEGTYINDKPGVSLALISGIGYNLNRESFQEKVTQRLGTPNVYKRVEKQDLNIEKNLLALRLPLIFFNGLFALFLFWLIKKITDDYWVSFWSFNFILLSPILLGMSQIINPDTLLWSFSAGATLSLLAFLKTNQKRLAVFSSLCLGMALLSKYSATILFPFFIVISLTYLAYKIKTWQEEKKEISLQLRNINISVLAIIAGSILVYALGMPAVFKIKGLLFEGTIGFSGMKYFLWPLVGLQVLLILESFFFKNKFSLSLFEFAGKMLKKAGSLLYLPILFVFVVVLLNWSLDLNPLNLSDLLFDLGKDEKFNRLNLHEKIFYEMRPLIFSLTPLTLFSLMFFWLKTMLKKKLNFLVFAISAFLLVFYAGVIFEGLLVTIRYSIMLYPLVLIIAAFGVKELYATKIFQKINVYLFSLLLILISGSSLWAIKPFYFNYTSFLLPQKHLITGAWGYGGYEAAGYLNSLPGAENFIIWSDYPGVCEFTKGKCYITNQIENAKIDYFVLTRRGKLTYANRFDLVKARPYYNKENPAWQMIIDNRPDNYIKVLKNEK